MYILYFQTLILSALIREWMFLCHSYFSEFCNAITSIYSSSRKMICFTKSSSLWEYYRHNYFTNRTKYRRETGAKPATGQTRPFALFPTWSRVSMRKHRALCQYKCPCIKNTGPTAVAPITSAVPGWAAPRLQFLSIL